MSDPMKKIEEYARERSRRLALLPPDINNRLREWVQLVECQAEECGAEQFSLSPAFPMLQNIVIDAIERVVSERGSEET